MKRKAIITSVLVFMLAAAIISGVAMSFHIKKQVKDLFKLNKSLQEEGYYMAEFEFIMLGFSYYLDKGYYRKSLAFLSAYHKELEEKDGLVLMPEFDTNKEEMEFYLNLQNPKTGAFMDDTSPLCTYWSCTENVLLHLEALEDSTTGPFKLKYPLRFLDEINTPEKLEAYLNDISYVGWLAPRFPQTTFHFARDMLNISTSDNIVARKKLYPFSPEWKQTMLKWMYGFQDTTTGMWGPKSRRTKKLAKHDMNNTASILKAFRDNDGNNLYKEFPLQYRDQLFRSAIEELSEPFPADDDLDDIHEWNLRQSKGIKMLLRHLWKDATVENKKDAEKIILRNIDICFDRYYVASEGAFSYYPNSEHASCDGMTNMVLDDIGAFSYKKQCKYWGCPQATMKDMGEVFVNGMKVADLGMVANKPNINSLRFYLTSPDIEKLTDNVWAVYYPKTTKVLDVMELVPGIVNWTETSSLSMGNWKSMAEIKNDFLALGIQKPLVFKDGLPMEEINKKFRESSELVVIAYDKLQIPRYMVSYKQP